MVDHEIVVVGAGFSGIGLGIQLKKAGFEDFRILDAADGIGGVWHHNRGSSDLAGAEPGSGWRSP